MNTHPTEADELEAQAVPLQEKNLIDVPADAIPLPPVELRDQLDNSEADASAEDEGPAEEVATLEFVGDDLPEATFPLRHPFRWEGRRYDTITVRMLTTAEVGRIVGRATRAGRNPDRWDIYAEMVGLPAKVLRALPSVDGDPIIDKAFDFLPPLFRPGGG